MDKNAYYIAEWNEDSEWSEDYSMLKGPNGFECCLTEPEDRVWYRDGQGVIGELNRLYAELAKPITDHPDVQRLKKFVQNVADTYATGGDPEYECELCRGELQYSAKQVLKGE